MSTTQNLIAEVEQRLNNIDYIPIASSFSGMFRIYLGAALIVTSVALTALQALAAFLAGKGHLKATINQGLIYSLHGLGNIARGAISMIAGLNLLLIVYDLKIGRMNYVREILREGVYPYMTAWRLANSYVEKEKFYI